VIPQTTEPKNKTLMLIPFWKILRQKGRGFVQNSGYITIHNLWFVYCTYQHQVGWIQLCSMVPGGWDIHLKQEQTGICWQIIPSIVNNWSHV